MATFTPVEGNPFAEKKEDKKFASQKPEFVNEQFAVEQPEQDNTKEFVRQLGLTARAGITGVAGLPLMAGDALNLLINKIAGTQLQMPSQALQPLLTRAGLPEPQGSNERISQEVASALAGVGGTAKLAQTLAPKALGTGLLTENMGLQAAGAIGGAGAAGTGREYFDAGTAGQLGLAVLGGMAAPTAGSSVTQALARGTKEVVRPFTAPGREVIVGNVLRQLSNAPETAAARMEGYQPPIPGYTPTTAQASRDLGLISAETPIRALDTTGKFAAQASEANKARMTILNRMAKDQDAVDFAIAKRDEVTAPLREKAFAASTTTPEQFQSAITLIAEKKIDDILKTPSGKRATVISVLEDTRNDIKRANTPEELYEIRKDLRAASQGLLDKSAKGGASAGAFKAAKNELNDVIRAVDDVIDSAAPGYRDYLNKYAQASKGIERMEAVQGFKGKVLSNAPDPINDEYMLSQPKFVNAIRAASKETKMSEMQLRALSKVGQDLDDGVLSKSGKAPGSDTFKNLSTANVIGGIIGKQMFGEVPLAANKIAAPLNWLYNGTDDQIREILVDAMLDPKLASRLMSKASTTTIEPLSKELQRKAINMGYGAAFGLTGE